jgi:hypothetical protein
MMHRFNHVFGHVLMNMIVRQLCITKMKGFVQCSLNYSTPVIFSRLKILKQA